MTGHKWTPAPIPGYDSRWRCARCGSVRTYTPKTVPDRDVLEAEKRYCDEIVVAKVMSE